MATSQKSELIHEAGEQRLDRVLAAHRLDLSRAHIQRLIKEGRVTVDGQEIVKPSYRLEGGERITLDVPAPEPQELVAEAIPVPIIFQNEDVLVVNKPAGMVVHPAAGHESGTLVNALLAVAPQLALVGGTRRPGIVHRLDKDTSGIIVIALREPVRLALKKQFQDRLIRKRYLALVEGKINPPEGIIDAPIGRSKHRRKRMAVVADGREAQSEYHTLETLSAYSLVEVYPKTGRTHQIRVHMASIGHPLAGDTTYGRRKSSLPLHRQFLHAFQLTLRLPGADEEVCFTAPLPNDLKHVLRHLQSEWPLD